MEKKYWDMYCQMTLATNVYLCHYLDGDPMFELVRYRKYIDDDVINGDYWGRETGDECSGLFNGLRQNIVLLMAAMNDEL